MPVVSNGKEQAMATLWCLVADASRARLFELVHPGHGIREIETVLNPEGRAQNRELDTDGSGRFYGKGERQQGHTAPAQVSAVDHDVELFAKSLVARIEKGRTDARYDRLCLVAAPRFLGMLRGHLGKDAERLVELAIDKDLSRAPEAEVERALRDQLGPRQ